MLAPSSSVAQAAASVASPAAAAGDSGVANKIKIKVLKPPSFIKFKTEVMEISNAAAAAQRKAQTPAMHLNLLKQIRLTEQQKAQMKQIYD